MNTNRVLTTFTKAAEALRAKLCDSFPYPERGEFERLVEALREFSVFGCVPPDEEDEHDNNAD